MSGPFLPERLRPRAPRRRGRPPVVLLLAAAVLPALAPWWRLQKVEVTACEGLPASAVRSLDDLEGRFALAVDPRQVARQLEAWPAVAAVDVRLELPATLRVRMTPVLAHGSVAMGRRWRAVAADGRLGGPLDRPWTPVLEGFSRNPRDLEKGLEIGRRLGATTDREVEVVRRITPDDYEVRLAGSADGGALRVWVAAATTAGERYWCAHMARAMVAGGWADLRQEDRVVVGGAG